jgi:anaerobic magnesium-protoporphyrin IX monomethyl ester cyclase
MRVLLIHPQQGTLATSGRGRSSVCEPLGMQYIGAALAAKGHRVEMLWEPGLQHAVDFAASYKPEVVGQSVYSCGVNNALRLATVLRDVLPDTRFIYGGPHPSASLSILESYPSAICIAGEPDRIVGDVLERINSPDELGSLNGVYFGHAGNGSKPAICAPPDFSKLPWPLRKDDFISRSGIFTLTYPPPSQQKGMATLAFSRGCPFGCYYCAGEVVHGGGVRIRNYEDVSQEMQYIRSRYGVNSFFFLDSTFNVSGNHVERALKAITGSNTNPDWYTYFSLFNQTEEMVPSMAAAGCRKLLIGIESTEEETLNQLKGRPREHFETMIDKLNRVDQAGILTRGFLIIGLPTDTEESLKHTVTRISRLPLDEIHITYYTPTPGTSAFTDKNTQWIHPEDRFSSITLHSPAIVHKNIGVDDLIGYRLNILRAFYGSESYRRRIKNKIKAFPHLERSFEEFFALLEQWGYF